MLKVKFSGKPGAEVSIPLFCAKCRNPIKTKKGKSSTDSNSVGICKKCLCKAG